MKRNVFIRTVLFLALALLLLLLPACTGEKTPDATPTPTPDAEPEGVTTVAFTGTEETDGKADVRVSVDKAIKPVRVAGEVTRNAFVRAYLNYAIAGAQNPGQRATLNASSSNSAYVDSYLSGIAREIAMALTLQTELVPVSGNAATSIEEVLAGDGTALDITTVLDALAKESGTRCSGSADVGILYNDSTGNMDALYPVAYHLIEDGVLPRMVVSSGLTENGVPEEVSLLILVGEGSCTFSDEEIAALADWVREGGTLLCIGGTDGYGKNALTTAVLKATGTEGSLSRLTLDRDESPVPVGIKMEAARALTVRERFAGDQAVYTLTGGETFLSLGGQNYGVRTAVGKGNLLLLGLSSSLLENEPLTANFVREVVAYGLQCAGSCYVSSDAFVVERGNYRIVRTMDDACELKGLYLNLLSGGTDIVKNPTVEGENIALYYALGEEPAPGSVLYSTVSVTLDGSVLTVEESDRQTETVILTAPEGLNPGSVSVTSAAEKTFYKAHWDKENRLLVLTLVSVAGGEKVTLSWSETDTFVDKGYTVRTLSVPTNDKNLDKDFLYFCNAGINSTLRFADLNTEIIYRFPMNKYNYGTVSLHVVQNYIIEISPDAESWQMIADYSQGGTVPHTKAGNNSTTITVTREMYGDWTDLYVRIRNSDVTQGWGGSISGFTITYITED